MCGGFWRQCSAHHKEIPLQKMGRCSLAQLKAYCTVLDATVSLSPHSECVAKVAELVR